MLMVAVLTLALSPFGSVLAYANEGGGVPSGEQGEGATASSTQVEGAGGAEAIADGNTASTWRDWGLENSTENVGHIWTDKTVQANDIVLTGADGEKTAEIKKGDSTFLTALSAISSTSNLKSTSTTPLDIVLVLDASGSMNDPMGNGDRTSRIDALKEAANAFIDEIAKQNAGVMDAAKQHQVAIVKFAGDKSELVGDDKYQKDQYWYNYSRVMKNMAVCTDASKSQYEDAIESISPAGATRSDYGMELAKDQTSGRNEAKKIVVFFTDGKPTSYSNYDPKVAKGAVDAAKTMKDAGASMYTIGIFEGADPSADANDRSTSNENKFMQAASSNYPNATYASDRGEYTWNFGTRAENSDFYKSATNADELKKVFDDISKEIVKDAGYPTETQKGYEADSGFITFTDQLGDYMKVDGFTTVVFANKVFEKPTKTTNGLMDAYTFTGEAGNALYPKGNLRDIDITVTRSNDLKTGDKVEVKIPAALIPLHHFQVNEDGTGSVDLTFPIRAFYGSSLKTDAVEALANPDGGLASYIANNSENGKVSFLANKWSGGTDGDVVANFTPSKGNSYYYITEDTPIYQDETCTQQANAPLEKGKTYYYKRTWYDISNSKATQQTKAVRFDSGALENIDGYISRDGDGKAYFKAGTPRMTYINELNTAKGADKSKLSANSTSTAKTFINPKWAGEQVSVLLGNNGKLSVAQPGTLEISKTLEVPAGYSADEFANDSFEFAIAIPKAANTTLKAQVKNATGEAMGDAFDIAFNEAGNATQSLKNGETLSVYGLAAGVEYTVTEMAKAGFTQTAPADEAGKAVAATGAIEAGKTAHASFTNAYSASGTLNGETALAGEKILTGRDMAEDEKFGFTLSAADKATQDAVAAGVVTLPDAATVMDAKNGEAKGFAFGSITFSKPGTYAFNVSETQWNGSALPEDDTNGLTFDRSAKTVTVTVTDDHEGSLKAEVAYPESGVAFVNQYGSSSAFTGIKVSKTLTGRVMKAGEFGFTIEGVGNDSRALLTESDKSFTNKDSRADGVAYEVTKLSNLTFTQENSGKVYEFVVKEVIPEGATYDETTGLWLMENLSLYYDGTAHTVKISVTDNGKGTVETKTTVDGEESDTVSFTNKYVPTPCELNIATELGLNKSIEGRPWKNGDSFTFNLTPVTAGAPMPVKGGVEVAAVTVTSDQEKEGHAPIDFGSIIYEKAGVYQYRVTEEHAGEHIGDLLYTNNVADITVTVTDDGQGKLTAAQKSVEGATFTNLYQEFAYNEVPIIVTKEITGTSGKYEGQFNFVLEALDDGPLPEGATPSGGKGAIATNGADGFVNFGNLVFDAMASGAADSVAADGAASGSTDGQDVANGNSSADAAAPDAGPNTRTFEYVISEQPGDIANITYDQSKLHFVIKAKRDAQGQITAEITRMWVEGGETPGPAEVPAKGSSLHTFVNTYTPPYVPPVDPDPDPVFAAPSAKKILEGRALVAGEFSFELVEKGKVVSTGTNTATGDITFNPIKYTAPGTHTYTMHEVRAGTTEAGVTYDATTYTVTAKVTKSGGKLQVEYFVEGADGIVPAVFKNVYEPAGATVVIGATKTLAGKELSQGQFTFRLVGADGTVVEATNDANGNVAFPKLSFDKEGTYEFTMTEVKDNQVNVTYDDASYRVVVIVTDDGKGQLVTEASYPDGTPAFANSYVESVPEPGSGPDTEPTATPTTDGPTAPGKSGPVKHFAKLAKTGDGVLLAAAPVAVGMVAAFAVGAIAFRLLRKRG